MGRPALLQQRKAIFPPEIVRQFCTSRRRKYYKLLYSGAEGNRSIAHSFRRTPAGHHHRSTVGRNTESGKHGKRKGDGHCLKEGNGIHRQYPEFLHLRPVAKIRRNKDMAHTGAAKQPGGLPDSAAGGTVRGNTDRFNGYTRKLFTPVGYFLAL